MSLANSNFIFLLLWLFAARTAMAHEDCTASFNFQKPGQYSVSFSDLSVPEAGDQIISWSWNFDDGTTSSQRNPSHTFDNPGKYDVELEIESQGGCKDKATARIFICDILMQATISACNGNGEALLNVVITDAGDFLDDIILFLDDDLLTSASFPAGGIITFESDDQFADASLAICDMSGQVMKKESIVLREEFTYSLESLSDGIYLLSITTRQNVYRAKFIKLN